MPALAALAEPSSPPLRYEVASPGLVQAGAGLLSLRGSVKREARAGSWAARGARGPARVPGERGLGAPGTRRTRQAPDWLNSASGSPFPLRGISDHDSRSLSLSSFPSFYDCGRQVFSGRPGCPGGRRKVPHPLAETRAECPGRVPEIREPGKAASRALAAHSPAAAGAEGGPRGAELSAASRPVACFHCYPTELGGGGGRWPPSVPWRLSAAGVARP